MARPRLRDGTGFRIPFLITARNYRREWFGHDLIAGISACIVMIPAVIAYAELVHLPPIAGRYAAFAASIGYALFASSRHVIAGPDAAIGLLAGTAILPLAGGDTARMVMLATELALLSGAVLLLAAKLNLGAIADLLSRPVLIGYLNGASLILVSTQLGKMFGITLEGEEFFQILYMLALKIEQTHLATLSLGLGLIAMLLIFGRKLPRLPRRVERIGTANLAAGLLQGFLVSASQSRTAIVDAAGGKSQMAQMVAAAGLLLFLLFFTGVIALLPKVALGAILIVTALGMLEVASLSRLYHIDRKGFWLAIAVMVSILFAGVVPGIILGMLLSLIGVLVEISRPRDAVLSRLRRDGKFHDVDHDEPDAEQVPS